MCSDVCAHGHHTDVITYRDNLDVGIKFAVHSQNKLPLLSVDGMSAPPGTKALAALSVRNVRRT